MGKTAKDLPIVIAIDWAERSPGVLDFFGLSKRRLSFFFVLVDLDEIEIPLPQFRYRRRSSDAVLRVHRGLALISLAISLPLLA